MKPKLSKEQQAALFSLRNRDQDSLDEFEKHVLSKYGQLLFFIERAGHDIEKLKQDLFDIEQALVNGVGQVEAIAEAYMIYLSTKKTKVSERPLEAREEETASGGTQAT